MSVLKSIRNLFDSFHSNNIQYVHWKSNINLIKALQGEDDLDLLVSPADKEKIFKIFQDLKILRGYSEKDSWQKNVSHYFLFDEATASIAHLHIHFELPVGYDYNKNFILPVVDGVLEKKVMLHGVYVSSPEHEYILLVLRTFIKNALTPFLLSSPMTQIKLIKGTKIVAGNSWREFIYLRNIIDETKLKKYLQKDFNFIDMALFRSCEAEMLKNKSLIKFLKLSFLLKQRLKPYRVKTEIASFTISFIRINRNRILKIKRVLFGNKIQGTKFPEYGGRIFAFVGGDGAGKSTNIAILQNELSKNFKTSSIHIGKPPKSIIGGFLYYFSRLIRILGLKKLSSTLMNLYLAIDRKKAFLKAKKLREKGVIVILDRLPLIGITAMDCPRIDSRKYPRLAKLEKERYEAFSGVDLLFVMKLNPEIALQRRPNDDADTLRLRSGQIWNMTFDYPYEIVSDTDELDFFQVEQKIISEVWKNMVQPFKRIELVGLSGSGKTTISEEIKTLYGNVLKNLTLKKYPLLAVKTAIQYPLGAIYTSISSKKHLSEINNFRLQFLTSVFSNNINAKNGLASHLVLDQNIVFIYVMALKEGYITEGNFIASLNKLSDCLDLIVFLDAPKKVLFERIKTRKNQGIGRAKDMSYQEFSEFYDQYYSAFQVLEKTKLNLLRIDTYRNTPVEISSIIMNHPSE